MDTLTSQRTGPAGERVLLLPGPAPAAALTWADGRAETDVTGWLADLILVGWLAANEPTLDTPPEEQVEVCTLAVSGFEVYLLDADAQPWLLDEATTHQWAMVGVTRMIVAGVTHEATQDDPVPDTPADLAG